MLVVTGIHTDIGKTLISAWLCIHTRWQYWKPIQTGVSEGELDSNFVHRLAGVEIVQEQYQYKKACSPHEASILENDVLAIEDIILPQQPTIIEGIGGVCVPLTMERLLIDLFTVWSLPTLLVSSSYLGAINHTLLSIEVLQARSIPLLGIIVSGDYNKYSHQAIEQYSKVPILGYIPQLESVDTETLVSIPLPHEIITYCGKVDSNHGEISI